MYIETSPPRVANQNAVMLTTSVLPADNAARCLKFWYHMWGNSVGSLRVWLGTRTGSFTINRIQQLFQQPRECKIQIAVKPVISVTILDGQLSIRPLYLLYNSLVVMFILPFFVRSPSLTTVFCWGN